MNCKNAQGLLSAYLDGELDGVQMIDIRQHLCRCRDCSADFEELRSVKRLLGQSEEVEVPFGFDDRLVAYVLAGPTPERRSVPTWRWAVLSSMAAAVTVLSVLQFLTPKVAGPVVRAPDSNRSAVFDVSRDQMYVAGSDQFGGQGPALPANHVSGR